MANNKSKVACLQKFAEAITGKKTPNDRYHLNRVNQRNKTKNI